jgi:gamma-glutamylcyclotransferase (GGCT)/AIG2-like uncharacterized protein YtfP
VAQGDATAESRDYLATYGTLMSGYPTQRELGVDGLLDCIGPCILRGDLFDLGEYPGLATGSGEVHGELYRVLDARVFETLDPFELYDPANPEASFYQRTRARLVEPDWDAWVYILSARPEANPHIISGRWGNC